MPANDIWNTEKSFWLDGPTFYREHMVPAAKMIFPDPVGIMEGEAIIETIENAPRWDTVEMRDQTETSLGDTLVLAYRSTGRRSGSAPYAALCSSTYVRQGGEWRLISHQQTPIALVGGD